MHIRSNERGSGVLRRVAGGLAALSLGVMAGAAAAESHREAPQEVLYISSAGLEKILVDPRDQFLVSALRMLEDRIAELPAELGRDGQIPEALLRAGYRSMFSASEFVLQVDPAAAEEGRPPFGGQLTLFSADESTPQTLAGFLSGMLQQQGMPIEASDVPGIERMDTPMGTGFIGSTMVGGKPALTLGLNRLDTAPMGFGKTELPMGVEPLLVVRANLRALTPVIASFLETMPPEQRAQIEQAVGGMGFMGDDAMVIEAAYGQGDRASHSVIRMVDYRGLGEKNGLTPENTLTSRHFAMIPSDATRVAASAVDLRRTIGNIRDAYLADMPPEAMEQVVEVLGFDPIDDFLMHLGTDVIMYQSDATGGGGLLSTVMTCSLSDADAFGVAMSRISNLISTIGEAEARGYVRTRTQTVSGHRMTTLEFPGLPIPVSPSWSITNGRLFAAATPGALSAALSQAAGRGEGFDSRIDVRRLIGGKLDGLVQLRYMDTERQARGGYSVVSLALTALNNAVRSPGNPARVPEHMVPSYNEYMRDVIPSVSVSRWDGDDLLTTSTGNRSALVNLGAAGGSAGGPMVVIAGAGLLAGVAMPAMERARESAVQVKSASMVRQHIIAAISYAAENDNKLPRSLEGLVEAGFLGPDALVSPYGNGRGDYTVRTDLATLDSTKSPGTTVYMLDLAMLEMTGMTNAGFLDGHVELLDGWDLSQLLKRAENRGAKDSLDIPEWMLPD